MRQLLELETYIANVRWIGLAALVVAVVAWAVDITGLVYECPYCRVQRSVIGILGVFLMLPNPAHWIVRFLASVIGFFGGYVAAAQNFMGWRRMSAGEFAFYEQIYVDPFLLSGCALIIIAALVWLHFLVKPRRVSLGEVGS